MRFYSAAEVHDALDLQALADAIARALSSGVVAPLRHAHSISATDSLLLMPAWSAGGDGAIGVKLVTVFPGLRARDAAGERGRASSTVNAVYVLMDRATGVPRAVIDGEALTVRRTAAASLLAARYLARSDARSALIVGTGRLARFIAHAHCIARKIERVSIWGRHSERAQSLAKTLRDEGLPAEAVCDLEHQVNVSHIVSCATTATSPVVHGAWLAPGTHLDLVGAFKRGMREVDDAAVVRARVYVDTYAGALAEADDIIEPIERGAIERQHIVSDLAALVSGAAPGRVDSDEITLFKSVGTAIEDLAAAQLLVDGPSATPDADR